MGKIKANPFVWRLALGCKPCCGLIWAVGKIKVDPFFWRSALGCKHVKHGKCLESHVIMFVQQAIRGMRFDVSDYVDDWYKYNLQEKIYSRSIPFDSCFPIGVSADSCPAGVP